MGLAVIRLPECRIKGEIRQGIDNVRYCNPGRAHALKKWFEELVQSLSGRLLLVDEKVAQNWGSIKAGSILPVSESLRWLSTPDDLSLDVYALSIH